jgi:diacylglycerol kinase family enzyme
VAPDADPADATLDVIGIEAPNRRAVLRMLASLRRGREVGHLRTHAWRTPSLTLRTNGSSPIIGDSTDLGYGPLELRALPAALRIVRP